MAGVRGKRDAAAESGRAQKVVWRRRRPVRCRYELEAGAADALCRKGAGKPTFLSIVMGIYRRDAGEIWRNGREVEHGGPAEAPRSRAAIVEQELSFVPQMAVDEYFFLGREPPGRFSGSTSARSS